MKKIFISAMTVIAVGAVVTGSNSAKEFRNSSDLLLLKNVEALSIEDGEGNGKTMQYCGDTYKKATGQEDPLAIYELLVCDPCNGSTISVTSGREDKQCERK